MPQSEPLDERQVMNNAGGYVYELTDNKRLLRFLILGSESGTYYQDEPELTVENADTIRRMISEGHGKEVVELVRSVSVEGRAHKQGPTLFALAACAHCADLETRRAAFAVLRDVCRIPTHLFEFLTYATSMGASGTGGACSAAPSPAGTPRRMR